MPILYHVPFHIPRLLITVALLLTLVIFYINVGPASHFRHHAFFRYSIHSSFPHQLPPQSSELPSKPSVGSVTSPKRYAYVQYATGIDNICNSLQIFATLKASNSSAERVLIHSQEWSPMDRSPEGRLLKAARDSYDVVLKPVVVQEKLVKGQGDGQSASRSRKLELTLLIAGGRYMVKVIHQAAGMELNRILASSVTRLRRFAI
jgi:hypothetical protein